ncbi:NYN domain-containing protein [Myxococcus sp. K38C18041901]|uniref:NYN domain-containing protein n=1 Tax=Myxococcus guangdongensis TaxID=2906760 RepID=UPI0020A7ADB8|nr:NYN domain-containing protein [Myxococcus guangdongensis]MCP3063395.1 NYN domain-containing protein [Myxococcus guangdongensis]
MNGRTNEHRIALFLDFENLVTNTGISASNFDLQPSLDRLLEKGKVVFRRAYCDWSRFSDAKIGLHRFGVELIDVPPSTRAGKNGADMRLVIDALELCYARESIDTFVIASGDSDFCPLAYKLRENGRTVIGLAVKESTSPLFVNACDEFIYLRTRQRSEKNDKGDKGRHGGAAEEAGHGKRGRHGRDSGGKGGKAEADKQASSGGKAHAKSDVPQIAREVVQNLLARATGPVNPSLIKETIVRKEPDFDESEYGFATFAKLLAALEQEGVLRRIQQGRQWYVVGADADLGHGGDTKEPKESKGKKHGKGRVEEVEEELESYPDPDEDDGL